MVQVPIVVGVMRNAEGKVFLTQRNQPGTEWHDRWQIPGGQIEYGEDAEAAIMRELKEETGFDVSIIRLLPKVLSNVHQNDGAHIIIIAYECEITGGEFSSDDAETKDGRFFTPGEIDGLQRLPLTKEIIDLLETK